MSINNAGTNSIYLGVQAQSSNNLCNGINVNVGSAVVVTGNYVTENGSDFYVTEDGLNFYVTES